MPGPLVPTEAQRAGSERQRWLGEFRAGTRAAMTELYVDHFSSVERSVGRFLHGADKETVVHEVFYRLIADAGLRASFRDGSLRAWLCTVARNHALDYCRRRDRERPCGNVDDMVSEVEDESNLEAAFEARTLIDRFCRERLPARWRAVFEARFVQELDQSEAARTLGIRRTTLLYQEFRILQLLRKFFLRTETL